MDEGGAERRGLEADHAALNAAVGAEALFLREFVFAYLLGDGA